MLLQSHSLAGCISKDLPPVHTEHICNWEIGVLLFQELKLNH